MYVNKAFTLIELLVTVVIVGILATITLSNFNQFRRQANDLGAISQARSLMTAQQAFVASNPIVHSFKDDRPSKHNYVDFQLVVLKPTLDSPPEIITISAAEYYFGDYTIEQILPGFVDDPKISFVSAIRTYFGNSSRLIFEGTAAHCFGTFGASEYSSHTTKFGFTIDEFSQEPNQEIIDKIGSSLLLVDGSNCP